MGSRDELQTFLEGLLGSRNVYFQPPASTQMRYPAIVYSRDDIDSRHANNKVYTKTVAYSVTVIDKDSESPVIDKIADLPMCSFDRRYVADNLNHDVFTLYF